MDWHSETYTHTHTHTHIGTLSVLRPTRAKAVLAVYRTVMRKSFLRGVVSSFRETCEAVQGMMRER